MSNAPRIPSGTSVGGYVVEEYVGSGGMADVYRATHKRLRRVVGLKVLTRGRTTTQKDVDRFIAEGENLAKIRHPHVIQILDSGEDGEWLFLVMDYVERSLKQILKAGLLEEREAVRLAHQLGGALDAGHAQEILHRDVKPANILVDHNYYLADFGVSRAANGAHLTTGYGIVGTRSYASPEQLATRRRLTPASDQYSFALVLREALTGQTAVLPGDATTGRDIERAPIVPLAPAVASVFDRALAEVPADRWPTCTAFAAAFEAALTEPAVVAAPSTASAPKAAADEVDGRPSAWARLSSGATARLVPVVLPDGSIEMAHADGTRADLSDAEAFPDQEPVDGGFEPADGSAWVGVWREDEPETPLDAGSEVDSTQREQSMRDLASTLKIRLESPRVDTLAAAWGERKADLEFQAFSRFVAWGLMMLPGSLGLVGPESSRWLLAPVASLLLVAMAFTLGSSAQLLVHLWRGRSHPAARVGRRTWASIAVGLAFAALGLWNTAITVVPLAS